MVYERIRGWTSGQSLPIFNFVKYPPPPRFPDNCHSEENVLDQDVHTVILFFI